MKRFELRLPKELHEKLRKESFDTLVSMNTLVTQAIQDKYKEEKKMKKYYLSNQEFEEHDEIRTFLELDEEDIEDRIDLAGLVYTTDVENIEEYDIEDTDGDLSMSKEESIGYTFARESDFNYAEQKYILEKEITGDIEEYMNEEQNLTEEEMIEQLEKSIKEKMKQFEWSPSEYKSYTYWDGSNHKEIVLDHESYDSDYQDCTEELEGMKEIDRRKGNTFIEKLYETKNGEKVLVTESFYHGSLPTIAWVDSETIGEE